MYPLRRACELRSLTHPACPWVDSHHHFGLTDPPCLTYMQFLNFILFLVQERKKPSLNWLPILLRPPLLSPPPPITPFPAGSI